MAEYFININRFKGNDKQEFYLILISLQKQVVF